MELVYVRSMFIQPFHVNRLNVQGESRETNDFKIKLKNPQMSVTHPV